jgi:hypothetical protein
MMFILRADAMFEADDIEDAARVLAKHFANIAAVFDDAEEEDFGIICGGTITIEPYNPPAESQ